MVTATAFAPVNIAWIKYMGKENGLPTNSSLSMTLKDVGTTTMIRTGAHAGEFKVIWDQHGYVPPEKGQLKVQAFLTNERMWKEALASLGYDAHFPIGPIEIFTRNTVPAGTGIATSASAFAALTLAWAAVLTGPAREKWMRGYLDDPRVKSVLAEIARKGSGSACRSFDGPWVEWHPRTGIHRVNAGKTHFVDLILLIEREPKEVSSSEAHERVKTSPRFLGRVGRVETRLSHVKQALKKDDFQVLRKEVLDEAMDMHELFHTSEPPFSYLRPLTREWIDRFTKNTSELPTQNGMMTLDAGANVHLFVPATETKLWSEFIQHHYPALSFVIAQEGEGAHYA